MDPRPRIPFSDNIVIHTIVQEVRAERLDSDAQFHNHVILELFGGPLDDSRSLHFGLFIYWDFESFSRAYHSDINPLRHVLLLDDPVDINSGHVNIIGVNSTNGYRIFCLSNTNLSYYCNILVEVPC